MMLNFQCLLSCVLYLLCAWLDQIPRLSGLELMHNYLALLKKYMTPPLQLCNRHNLSLKESFGKSEKEFFIA